MAPIRIWFRMVSVHHGTDPYVVQDGQCSPWHRSVYGSGWSVFTMALIHIWFRMVSVHHGTDPYMVQDGQCSPWHRSVYGSGWSVFTMALIRMWFRMVSVHHGTDPYVVQDGQCSPWHRSVYGSGWSVFTMAPIRIWFRMVSVHHGTDPYMVQDGQCSPWHRSVYGSGWSVFTMAPIRIWFRLVSVYHGTDPYVVQDGQCSPWHDPYMVQDGWSVFTMALIRIWFRMVSVHHGTNPYVVQDGWSVFTMAPIRIWFRMVSVHHGTNPYVVQDGWSVFTIALIRIWFRMVSVHHGTNPWLLQKPFLGSTQCSPKLCLEMLSLSTRMLVCMDLLNHCFADMESFMSRLQKAADAQSAAEESKKKKGNKKKKKKQQLCVYDLMLDDTSSPSEQEFVDIFQKMKYSFSLLDRLKNEISKPSSEELLHHLFVPLGLMVKTTGGPSLAASVSSPALTSGAVTLLQQNLTKEEQGLWSSLGPKWTQPYSQDTKPASPYTLAFLDGWQPQACDANGEAFEDPVESQHKYEAQLQSQQMEFSQASLPVPPTDTNVDNLPPSEGERLYRCSYDFVARNSSELSVLQGETLQVIESSKRWWKCRNSYDQIGFVPSNILEPVNHTEPDSHVVMRKPSTRVPLSPPGGGRFSYAAPSSSGEDHAYNDTRPLSMPPIVDEGGKVMLMNNELAQRLANGRTRPSLIHKANETASLSFHSPPSEVQEWLRSKGFGDVTVTSLGILSGAQLFSLSKEELCTVSPLDGARVYSQVAVQKALLEKASKSTELDAVMKKQKMKAEEVEAGEF
ncbi:hypothetical protein NFI96_016628 [Prochilodus magdalenae]|nr:hypothetical protein NFI96_016628 [Prochilodus magdalenae]